MIVLRSPKGWTCPEFIDGKKCEDYWRAHQVPMSDMDKKEHVRILERWMRSYRRRSFSTRADGSSLRSQRFRPKARAA
jgi:xylulose-5-phosphate/fructose-6-phosphate phosphoketolase